MEHEGCGVIDWFACIPIGLSVKSFSKDDPQVLALSSTDRYWCLSIADLLQGGKGLRCLGI